MSYVISIANNKGGVGKTTCTYNIATALAMQGKRVLMIDWDVQCDLTKSCGYKIAKRPGEEVTDFGGHSVVDIVLRPDTVLQAFFMIDDLDTYFRKRKGQRNLSEAVYLIPGSLKWAMMESEFYTNPDAQANIEKSISLLREYFHYILIDCPPTVGIFLVKALSVSDGVIIPLQPAFLDTEGTVLIDDAIESEKSSNPDFKVVGTILNRYKVAASSHVMYLGELSNDSEKPLLGVIKDTTLVTRAITDKHMGIPVILDAKNSQPAKEFIEIGKKIIEATQEGGR